jgi:nucleoside-diphosphate-sugar epimerase
MIFITGSNGLIGSFIARKCINEGVSVRALRRQNSDIHLLADIADQIEWVEGDVLDATLLHQAILPGDIVIHTAAIVSFAPQAQQQMLKVNVEGTTNVVNACLEAGVKKMCFISSVAALGRKKDRKLTTESVQWENSEFNTWYAHTKQLAEQEVWRGIAEGLPAVIVNPSVVLGPGDWDKSSTQLFKYVWKEKRFYSKGLANYVDVRDVADIIFRLIHSEIISERFILNAGSISYQDLFIKIAACFNKRPPKWSVLPWIAEVVWRWEYLRSLVTGKAPLVSRETARLALHQEKYDNSKIVQSLGFLFKPIDDTIRWTCTELQKQNLH